MPTFAMPTFKPTFHDNTQEFSPPPIPQRSNRLPRLVESLRLGLTLLILLCGTTIVGTTADTLSVYNTTHLDAGFYLPLWPTRDQFDIRPTVAGVICGSVIVLASGIALGISKIPTLKSPLPILLLPTTSLVASLISISFFYTLNASSTKFTLRSWSCQWENISMDTKPHWGTLCRESKVGIYLSVLILPLSLGLLAISVGGVVLGRMRRNFGGVEERKGSPAMS